MVAGRDRGHLVSVDCVVEEEAVDLGRHLLCGELRPPAQELLVHADGAAPADLTKPPENPLEERSTIEKKKKVVSSKLL